MADKKATSNKTGRNSASGRSAGGRKTSGSSGRTGSRTSSRGNERTSTSSRSYGRTSNYTARKRRQQETDDMRRDIFLVLLFAGMVFLFLSNFHLFGIVGGFFRTIMTGMFGMAAYILPVVIFALTLYGMMNRGSDGEVSRILCVAIMYLVLAVVCDLMSGEVDAEGALDIVSIYERCTETSGGGGVIGGVMAWVLMHTVRLAGTILVLVVISVICLVFITGKPLLRLMQDSAMDARDRARYRREAEDQYRAEHPEEYDDGFLPDEEDDNLTDEDIAEYRAQQAQRARAEREERLRNEARRDVERRHETRNQVYQTFRGIVGDTNLSNNPYYRQMAEEAAARAALASQNEMTREEDPAQGNPEVSQNGAPSITQNMPFLPQDLEEQPQNEWPQNPAQPENPAVLQQPVTSPFMTAEPVREPVHAPADTPSSVAASSTVPVRMPADTSADQASVEPAVSPAAVPTQKPEREETSAENVTSLPDAAATAAEVSASILAARQLIRNQRPGTDGIQLAVVSGIPDNDDLSTDTEDVRASVRQAIPIHRESSNLHEINALEFQGSYAALARNTIQTEEDDEDLTSRIIREGMAELERTDSTERTRIPAYGARSAAADAFSRSTAFTEIQDAYRRGAQEDMTASQVDPVSARDEAGVADSLEETEPGLQTDPGTPHEEPIPAPQADPQIPHEEPVPVLQTDPETPREETAPAQQAERGTTHDDALGSQIGATSMTASDAGSDPAQDAAEVLPFPLRMPGAEEPVESPEEHIAASAMTNPVNSEGASGMTKQVNENAPDPVREMTTPAGSGSVIAAEHAKSAMIHSDNTAQVQHEGDGTPHSEVAPSASAHAPSVPVKRPYVYPPLSLLSAGNPSQDSGSDEELRHTAEVLETTLHTFGVNCKITDISQGPAVTRYELLPEQGVKVSKVIGLSDDIKLALAAMDIRIEAPIPGKSAIGIEVPNKVRSVVALQDILIHPNFRNHPSKLAIGIGKDISGQIVVSDLAKMPHVLIAGATGSGKSVCINTIIMSILYHATPDEVKLLMVDPKVVELSVYNGIPHLLYPVVTNPQQAATLLNWAVAEMESRYNRFARLGVRDMKGYNQVIQQQLDQGITEDEDGCALHTMPRIVVIVDELADLMMVAKSDVETAICRLAQLARAAGIHLIIATQRPSVNVITGLIKANMPSRIAFGVSSGVDSRTILDMNGAEKLLGKGDMLFFPQGLPKPARIQGAFVDDDDVLAVVKFIKEQDPVDTQEEARIRQQMENLGTTGQIGSTDTKAQDVSNELDDCFYRAGKAIIEKNNASIGLLQRLFRIGFNRAARLMDQLCDAGVVAESEGTKSRRVLMTDAEFEAYCQQNEIH